MRQCRAALDRLQQINSDFESQQSEVAELREAADSAFDAVMQHRDRIPRATDYPTARRNRGTRGGGKSVGASTRGRRSESARGQRKAGLAKGRLAESARGTGQARISGASTARAWSGSRAGSRARGSRATVRRSVSCGSLGGDRERRSEKFVGPRAPQRVHAGRRA